MTKKKKSGNELIAFAFFLLFSSYCFIRFIFKLSVFFIFYLCIFFFFLLLRYGSSFTPHACATFQLLAQHPVRKLLPAAITQFLSLPATTYRFEKVFVFTNAVLSFLSVSAWHIFSCLLSCSPLLLMLCVFIKTIFFLHLSLCFFLNHNLFCSFRFD